GLYNLTAPTPGDYRVRVVLPGAGAFSPKDQGGDDLEDSDANSIGINAGFTDTFTLASNVISITKIDIGLINLPAILPTVTPSPTLTPTATSSPTLTPTVLPSAQPVPSRLNLPLVVN
ncbi:MAG TPA: SdrD B-like domain-containing protein, partial [Roseiflexaceae bacterium]|nr:SdrD B-like domain-containing protein [Roseiflexaceae bacterium]